MHSRVLLVRRRTCLSGGGLTVCDSEWLPSSFLVTAQYIRRLYVLAQCSVPKLTLVFKSHALFTCGCYVNILAGHILLRRIKTWVATLRLRRPREVRLCAQRNFCFPVSLFRSFPCFVFASVGGHARHDGRGAFAPAGDGTEGFEAEDLLVLDDSASVYIDLFGYLPGGHKRRTFVLGSGYVRAPCVDTPAFVRLVTSWPI